MNRQIKFRIWSLEAKEMFEDFPLVREDKYLNDVLADENYIFMQSTGLFDKNGKEVYEGDLITWGGGGIHLIEFRDTSWAFKNEQWLFSMITQKERDSFEVIGNIFENPDLIK